MVLIVIGLLVWAASSVQGSLGRALFDQRPLGDWVCRLLEGRVVNQLGIETALKLVIQFLICCPLQNGGNCMPGLETSTLQKGNVVVCVGHHCPNTPSDERHACSKASGSLGRSSAILKSF